MYEITGEYVVFIVVYDEGEFFTFDPCVVGDFGVLLFHRLSPSFEFLRDFVFIDEFVHGLDWYASKRGIRGILVWGVLWFATV